MTAWSLVEGAFRLRATETGVAAAAQQANRSAAEARKQQVGTISRQAAPRHVLGEQRGFSEGPSAVLDAFRSQRRRFITSLRGFDASAWHTPTRCARWSVHDVVRHVRDRAVLHVARLGGRPDQFGVPAAIHQPTTPVGRPAHSAGQTPDETLRELILLVDEEDRLLQRKARLDPSETRLGPLRRTLHWSVSSTHSFWDAWVHERDIALPLGLKLPYPIAELRLATMYGLLAAAAPAGWAGEYIRTTVQLEGSRDPSYEITHAGDNIKVITSPESDAELAGDAVAVLDSLAGRGPMPREVFGIASAVVSQLTLLREVAT
ncbi:maleylpyruvate isomerase family mycothiol-dependent enzyme [Streptomyces justiciae]|uniref:maleylpyruvate isomerase family mycothiol-dependent enzyme n=1 Tax=Streptomyces justiciae TaxID=2780140 RepID=UPI0021186AB6|nr:maleylpyruvate isomerase family mycothiol-dependent enzyme [Streptomyces justiciae]MCW8382535.1 maleylpyruvate isomerase family mycothiol-dependent enzyme [Streptomyces justiciae]